MQGRKMIVERRGLAVAKSKDGVNTDEKEQNFDGPVQYKARILDALSYVSDDFNHQMFDAHVLAWAVEKSKSNPDLSRIRLSDSACAAGFPAKRLNFADLCCCFGNTTMATVYGMTNNDIKENWSDEKKCKTIHAHRRLPMHVTGIDKSKPALDY
ncbi:hypothetical protein ACHAWF_000026 [Thalassiosira exigua]